MCSTAIVMIESSFSGHLFHRAIRDLGHIPVLLTADAGRYRHLDTPDLAIVSADTASIDAIVEWCQRDQFGLDIIGVLSSSSASAGMAASVCRRLGLPGAKPEAIERCLNKFTQRDCLKGAGLLSPSYLFTADPDAATKFCAEIGFPVIVKPAIGSGSMGVKLCSSLVEVIEQMSMVLGGDEFAASPGILIEQYVSGPEFSVETIGDVVIGITAKHLGDHPHFVEVGHDFPASLDWHVQQAIGATVIGAIRALDLLWGPAHTEIRLSADGPVIIEVNPRMAGELIPELVRLACGVDPVEATVILATGGNPVLNRTSNRSAGIRFVSPDRDGILHWGAGAQDARKIDGVVDVELHQPDSFRVQRRGDFRDRVGHVIAVTDDANETAHALENAMRALGARVEDG
ncbi:ATP-grasp domain-containing protein [Neorhizobium sp. BT27B]|uniref:ATP-grasp domain-containing protein n=1 Tax=Neorhizobium sp. BT27B TaxID=3142625 RepID=UPI003D28CECA